MKSIHYKLLSPVSVGESEDLLNDKAPEEGIRRIQALLADWLRMENVVVLTAAGCSFGCGGRLMAGPKSNNLECLVLDAVYQTPIPEAAKAIIRQRRSKWPGGQEGPLGFESWLSYLFNTSSLTSSDSSPIRSVKWRGVSEDGIEQNLKISEADMSELHIRIEKAIFAECALQIDRNELSCKGSVSSSGHIPFLAKLSARDTNLGRTHLFTLNYDTLFEQAMEELGIQYFDGYSGKSNSIFDPAIYGLDIYYPGDVAEGRVRRFDKFVQFYKLHGSLHWYVDDGGEYRARHRDVSFAASYRDAGKVQKASILESSAFSKVGSFGILPTSQKFTQTLGMPYAHLFRLFHARLNQPQTFFLVMGYGFGDEHVTRIIETALMNPSLVMLVVEPNPDSEIVRRIRRYQNLGQRAFVLTERLEGAQKCSYKVATFSDFACNVMPDVKWLDDYRRLRMFEEQIRKAEDPNPSGGAGSP